MKRVFVAVLLLLLIDTAAWAFVCGRLEAGVLEAVVGARENGWLISSDQLHWAGWPFAAEVDFAGVSVSAPVPAGLTWRAARAQVRLGLLHPTTLTIPIEGAQSVATDGMRAIPFTTTSMVIYADLGGNTAVRANLQGLRANTTAGVLTLDRGEVTFPADGVVADLAGIGVPGVAVPIAVLRLHAHIDPAFTLAADAQTAARAWREAGGHVDISSAALRWGALDASGQANITLDAQLQPEASGSLHASGLPLLLDALAQAGTITPAQATAAKAVIGLLAAASAGDSVALPFSVESSVLRIAGFPLLRFLPLAWN